jgi:hypothetical protein
MWPSLKDHLDSLKIHIHESNWSTLFEELVWLLSMLAILTISLWGPYLRVSQ